MPSCLGIELTPSVRPPVTDPTLGIDVPAPPARPWAHRLVTLGDSLTAGFQHFALFATATSWPVLVAEQLGVDLVVPDLRSGPGGHPLNLEWVARTLDDSPVGTVVGAASYLHLVKHYYTRGAGRVVPGVVPAPDGPRGENLSVWGWDLRDVLERTAASEGARIGGPGWSPLVEDSQARSAVTVLNSSRDAAGRALTPVRAARALGGENGGIETLCVWLGSNNVLRSVVTLRTTLSGPDFRDLEAKAVYTVWTVPDFTAELDALVRQVAEVDADHVLWATVPHVTIPPISHGLGGPLPECGRYFRSYARPWEDEGSFHPDVDAHLTGYQAWAVDTIIDGYNRALERVVEQARARGRDWRLVDTCAVLDRLAYRRNVELGARPDGFEPYPLPAALAGLDTRFFATDGEGRLLRGGLIGLDGVHPTTCGYGIVAQEFATAMAGAGVGFAHGPDLDFAAVRARDTLVTAPPPRLAGVLDLLRDLDGAVDLLQRLNPLG